MRVDSVELIARKSSLAARASTRLVFVIMPPTPSIVTIATIPSLLAVILVALQLPQILIQVRFDLRPLQYRQKLVLTYDHVELYYNSSNITVIVYDIIIVTN